MRPGDNRPFLALAAALLALVVLVAVPASREWLRENVAEPLEAQADPAPGLRQGYSVQSLLVWAAFGGVLAWAVYELAFVRLGLEADRAFFLSLAPALVLGPALHAALVVGVLPAGSALAYLASEPLVYLTVGAFAAIGIALGRALRAPVAVPLLWGLLGLAPLVVLLASLVDAASLGQVAAILALALVPAALLTLAYARLRPGTDPLAVGAVVAAHALDGATTWMVLRDPLGLGFEGFGERNPVSLTLVNLSTGWPYFALKLALPFVLLSVLKTEEGEERLRAFLLFAIFILGFGPGMANLLQVMLG